MMSDQYSILSKEIIDTLFRGGYSFLSYLFSLELSILNTGDSVCNLNSWNSFSFFRTACGSILLPFTTSIIKNNLTRTARGTGTGRFYIYFIME